ncbi:Integrase catalytic domain-containing protein [Aphis craccivora]|uniref:Integrase catalytic domain-containing protein n=1 Tax=Aphis craccivora TaxID=307492 RepID=A0A6G0Y1F3_APHCR|nr:Integrase catalytic domain-containing protein [Aphis craccivora]
MSRVEKVIPMMVNPVSIISSGIHGFTNIDNVSCYANSANEFENWLMDLAFLVDITTQLLI